MEEGKNLLGFLASPVEDRRLPAPDVKGILADFQIRMQQLDEIALEVGENWLGVCEVRAGDYNNHPYFAIHLDPFSEDLQRQHWALADRIDSVVGADRFAYYFLPRMEQSPFSSEIIIYCRDNVA